MGYPPGSHGYHVHSLATNHFFNSGNIIFDENIPYHALHEVSSTPVDYSSLPFPAAVLAPTPPSSHPSSPPASPLTPPSIPQPLTPEQPVLPTANTIPSLPSPPAVPPLPAKPNLCGIWKLTEGGRSYADSIQSAKDHLQKLCANREKLRTRSTADFAHLCHEGAQELPDSFGEMDDFTAATASLDVQDYLQQDADAVIESTLLSLRSDVVSQSLLSWV